MSENRCPVCEGHATIKYVTKAFGQGDNLLVIENIPVIVCRACHEQYITAQTLDEIERLREQDHHTSRIVPVERYAA
ncbi:MAG: YgiT-type zinc finger domain-containing protein [Halochromatium sp.]|nr:YgiT-type zinc finger domain-containing protein [Halochromatium sp.]